VPNYVGHIERKPVYDANGPLEYMDDILIRTYIGVREVMTEEWGKLIRDTLLNGVPLQKIVGGLFENPDYIFGLFWGIHLLPP
jgi:hypothetical protein